VTAAEAIMMISPSVYTAAMGVNICMMQTFKCADNSGQEVA